MRNVRRALAVAALAAAIALSACAHARVTYVDSDASYTAQQLRSLLDRTDLGSVANERVSKATELRHEALVELRSQGSAQSAAADVVTETFPAATESVPVYVERATFDSSESLILIEAWVDSRNRLSSRRLWVIDAKSGQVYYSASAGSRR